MYCEVYKQIHQLVFNFKLLKYESYIHNIAFTIEKVISSEWGEKYAQIKQLLQVKTV